MADSTADALIAATRQTGGTVTDLVLPSGEHVVTILADPRALARVVALEATNTDEADGWDSACDEIARGEKHPAIAHVYKRRNPYPRRVVPVEEPTDPE